jgi:hypothetical protein
MGCSVREWLALIGLWTVVTFVLRATDWLWRWLVQRRRDRRAIARVIFDSHRWDTWAKSHAGGGR